MAEGRSGQWWAWLGRAADFGSLLSWLWQWVLAHPWIWIWGTAIMTAVTFFIWETIEALPPSVICINILGVFAIGLLIANEIQLRRIRRKWEQQQLSSQISTGQQEALEATRRTIAELQAKIATIEDTQPRLKVTEILLRRQLAYEQQPQPDLGRRHKVYRGGIGFFALLRITNDPESKSRHAITNNLRARISYHDEKDRELFPSINGTWGDPDHKQQNGTIGDFYSDVSSVLRPQESIHLGIALRYPWGDPLACYAFNASSRRHPDWLRPELRLSGETIHVKVLITGDGIKEPYLCRLKDCGPKEGLQLELLPSPPPT